MRNLSVSFVNVALGVLLVGVFTLVLIGLSTYSKVLDVASNTAVRAVTAPPKATVAPTATATASAKASPTATPEEEEEASPTTAAKKAR